MDAVTAAPAERSADRKGLFHDGVPDQVIAALMAIAVTALALAWAADILHLVGLTSLYTGQMVALVLGFSCALIFLRRPAFGHAPRRTVPWYDRVFALTAAVAGVFLSIRFPVLYEDAFYHPIEVLVLSAILVPMVLECLRRATGWSLLLVVALFVCYALWGDLVPGKLQGRTMGIGELVSYVGLDTTAMLGRPIIIAVTIVIVFIFFGRLLLESGAADFFTDVSAALLGRSRGGSAKIAVAASAMFGSVSGSAVSNVATTGILTIPMMCKGGYSARAAAAIEAVASTGGQLAPPVMGAAAFLMAEFLQLPYRDIVVAAIIPAFLFYAAVFIQTDLEAARLAVSALQDSAIPKLRAVARAGWHLIAPFAVLIAVLFWLNEPAETAALAAAMVLFGIGLVVSYAGHKLRLSSIFSALRDAGYASVDIVVITAAAGIIIGILDRTGLSFGLGFVLVEFGQESLFLLLVMTALLSILLGMGMPTTGVYFLLAALAAPPLIKLGIEPIAAHMFVLYFGMLSMITPPVAIAAFTAANIAGTRPMLTAATAVRFGWPAYIIPFLFVLSPTLLMQGSVLAIILATATALIGVWSVTAAIAGYLMGRLAVPVRLGFAVVGLALLIPPNAFSAAPWINVAGGVGIALLIAPSFLAKRLRGAT